MFPFSSAQLLHHCAGLQCTTLFLIHLRKLQSKCGWWRWTGHIAPPSPRRGVTVNVGRKRWVPESWLYCTTDTAFFSLPVLPGKLENLNWGWIITHQDRSFHSVSFLLSPAFDLPGPQCSAEARTLWSSFILGLWLPLFELCSGHLAHSPGSHGDHWVKMELF